MKKNRVPFATVAASVLLGGALFAVPPSVIAGSFTARISGILLYEDGNLVYVYPQGGVQTPPACHAAPSI